MRSKTDDMAGDTRNEPVAVHAAGGAGRLWGIALALVIAVSLHAAPVLAEVVDNIAIVRHDSSARIRVRLTAPVHYIRQYASKDGRIINVYLQALAPGAFGDSPVPDEVKRSPEDGAAPRFTVRVSLDPRCEPVPHPVCIVIEFSRAVRGDVRLGEDRRSLLLDLPVSVEEGRPASVGEKP